MIINKMKNYENDSMTRPFYWNTRNNHAYCVLKVIPLWILLPLCIIIMRLHGRKNGGIRIQTLKLFAEVLLRP